jgi:DNA-binding transcriptional LysR family regulator
MMPRFVGTPHVNDGSLEDVGLAEPPGLRAGLYIVYPSSGQIPRKVTAFRDFLVDWANKSPFA